MNRRCACTTSESRSSSALKATASRRSSSRGADTGKRASKRRRSMLIRDGSHLRQRAQRPPHDQPATSQRRERGKRDAGANGVLDRGVLAVERHERRPHDDAVVVFPMRPARCREAHVLGRQRVRRGVDGCRAQRLDRHGWSTGHPRRERSARLVQHHHAETREVRARRAPRARPPRGSSARRFRSRRRRRPTACRRANRRRSWSCRGAGGRPRPRPRRRAARSTITSAVADGDARADRQAGCPGHLDGLDSFSRRSVARRQHVAGAAARPDDTRGRPPRSAWSATG